MSKPTITVAGFALLVASRAAAEPGYKAEIAAWRAEHEAGLVADGGWLSVAGLIWLPEGVTRFGPAKDSDLVLPDPAAPAGTLERHGATVTLTLPPAPPRELRSDDPGPPDPVTLGRLAFHIVHRGERWGVRLKDPENPRRKAFKGLRWYPVSPKLRVVARWEPWTEPRTLPVPNVLGDVVPMASPGRAVFKIGKKEVALEAVQDPPGEPELFFIFADRTTGRGTYGGGRFLYTALPADGQVVLDFNKAESPPCAFIDFATCPLPPRQNVLPVAVPAGERTR